METIYPFLKELARNNNREWFNEHKKEYTEALEQFRSFIGSLLEGLAAFDPAFSALDPKETIFRIYRDIRFSRDKVPYKTHFGSWMARGGRKSTDAGYYFHMEPGNSFMAAGVHAPPKEQLDLIRKEIVFQPAAYLELINDPSIRTRFERGFRDDMLKKAPTGFPKDFKYMEEIRYRHYIFSKTYSDQEVLGDGFLNVLLKDCGELAPLVDYFNHAMSFVGNG